MMMMTTKMMKMTMAMATTGSKKMEMIMLVMKDLRKWLKIFLTEIGVAYIFHQPINLDCFELGPAHATDLIKSQS